MNIFYWSCEDGLGNRSRFAKVLQITSPFKGVCVECKKRTLVRFYPYNCFSSLGVLCEFCYKDIDSQLNSSE